MLLLVLLFAITGIPSTLGLPPDLSVYDDNIKVEHICNNDIVQSKILVKKRVFKNGEKTYTYFVNCRGA